MNTNKCTSVLCMVALSLEQGIPVDISDTASSASLRRRPCAVVTLHALTATTQRSMNIGQLHVDRDIIL